MRFSTLVSLISVESVKHDEDGTFAEVEVEKMVFANPIRTGASTWAAERAAGLHDDATIDVRSDEYSDEQRVAIGSREYTVERVRDTGAYTRLTLRRRLKNGS